MMSDVPETCFHSVLNPHMMNDEAHGEEKEVLFVFVLTTLKQELSGESGEENKKLQLTGLAAALGKCFVTPGGLIQSAFI